MTVVGNEAGQILSISVALCSFFLCSTLLGQGASFTAPVPDEEGIVKSSNGIVHLEWASENQEPDTVFEVELYIYPEVEVELIYRGTDTSTYVTGLREGEYHFGIRVVGQEQSEPLRVEVKYFERRTVVILLSLGLIVVTLTIGAILRGHFKGDRTV